MEKIKPTFVVGIAQALIRFALSSFSMLFKDIIGQEAVKMHLTEMVQQNRLSHALLFLGKEGSGALPLAIAFAQYIVSMPAAAPVVEDLFGGMSAMSAEPLFIHPNEIAAQPAYQRATELVHPDLHFTYPVIPKKSGDKPKSADYITEWREFVKNYPYGNLYDWLQFLGAENKQGNISAEECNEIMRRMMLKSFESEYKVLVLWMPEYLGKEGNKLLKLIEEPPPNTVFILVAESEEQIISTILSRCQLIKIPQLSAGEIENALVQRNKTEQGVAKQVAAVCEGNYREALQILQHATEDWLSLLRDWLNAILRGGTMAQVQFVEEVSKLGREKQKQFFRYFSHLLEQSVRMQVLGEEMLTVTGAEKDFVSRFNKIAHAGQIQSIVSEIDHAAYFVERNANSKMLFQALSIKISYIIKHKVAISA